MASRTSRSSLPNEDGCVRKVKIVKADGGLDNLGRRRRPPTFLDRPIHKLVLQVPSEGEEEVDREGDRGIPLRGANYSVRSH